MEIQKRFEIFTDVSFDDVTKEGTYSIVIMQEKVELKTIARKCNVKSKNSLESEIFGIFQAINYITGSLLKKGKVQKFLVTTDCAVAKDFL